LIIGFRSGAGLLEGKSVKVMQFRFTFCLIKFIMFYDENGVFSSLYRQNEVVCEGIKKRILKSAGSKKSITGSASEKDTVTHPE